MDTGRYFEITNMVVIQHNYVHDWCVMRMTKELTRRENQHKFQMKSLFIMMRLTLHIHTQAYNEDSPAELYGTSDEHSDS